MFNRITTKSIFHSWRTIALFVTFFAVRIASFYLVGHEIIQAVLVFLLIMTLGIVFFKNHYWAWSLVLGELLLGGSGHFIEFFGLSIRTSLVLMYIFLWIIDSLGTLHHQNRLKLPHRLSFYFIPLLLVVLFAGINGMISDHSFRLIVQDTLPYLFFLTLLPAYFQFKYEDTQEYLVRTLVVFVIGSALFSLCVFLFYASGFGTIHDTFYTWFRDVAAGKITNMGSGFFRIVLPEHLLMTPLTLLVASLLMRNEKHNNIWRILLLAGVLILALNLSRIYLIALVIGLCVLKYKHSWYRWVRVSAKTLVVFLFLFTAIAFGASQGTSTGWDLIGLRFGSIAEPSTEVSATTRMALLEPIFTLIQQHPIIGHGLGASLTFVNPTTYQYITTSQFDWGYLEMWVELGFIGLAVILLIIIFTLYELISKIQALNDYHDFYVGLLAGLISFLVINITSPALFHVFGMFYLVFVIVLTTKPIRSFDRILTVLYRTFNREKM